MPIAIKKGLMHVENGRIRIADIAEELGLSTATVSNVIHGKQRKYQTKKSSVFRSFWKSVSILRIWQGYFWHRMILKL